MRWSKSVSLVTFVLVALLIASGLGASVWAQSGGGGAAERIAPPGQVAPPCAPLELKLNTGQTPTGTPDTNWQLVSAPQTAASPPATTAYSVTPYTAWFTPSSGSWISPFPTNYTGPAGNYVYQTTFTVSSSYTNVQLHIDSYAADNQGQLALDNVNIGVVAGFSSLAASFVVPLSAGTHTLRATVTNSPTLPSQTGLLVAARVTGDCVSAPPPPPASNTGRIIVDKVTIPAGDPTVFQFTSGYKAPFFLKDTDPPNDSGPIPPIAPAYYAVNEIPVPGWTTSIACKDPDGGTTVGPTSANPSIPATSASIDLDAGETIFCTFTNTKIVVEVKPGTIVIIKDAQPDDPLDFEFGGSWGQFFLDDDGINSNPLSNTKTFANLTPGPYTAKENVPPGWVLSIACNDPTGGTTIGDYWADINLAPGETVTCTFTNRKTVVDVKPGTIVIKKVAAPNGPQVFEFGGSWGQFFLDDDGVGGSATSNTRTFTNLTPGPYLAKENVPPGWVLSIVCNDPTGGTTIGDYWADINLAPGETVTCTFTNRKTVVEVKPGTIVVKKVAAPLGPQVFEFGGSWGQFFLDDDGVNNNPLSNTKTFANLTPGPYTAKEAVPLGWVLSIACNDPTGGTTVGDYWADINLAPGETVTCTFTNRKTAAGGPDLAIKKEATVSADGQTVTYSVKVANLGTMPAVGTAANPILVNDALSPLPAGAQFVSASGAGWTCTGAPGNGPVNCAYTGSLAPGDPPLTIEIVVNVGSGGRFENCATVTSPSNPGVNVIVPSTAGGINTGIVIPAGGYVTITASGTWYYTTPGLPNGPPVGPGADVNTWGLFNNVPKFSLVASLNGGPYQFVGAGPTVINGPGTLTLVMNDDYYPDNSGSMQATITSAPADLKPDNNKACVTTSTTPGTGTPSVVPSTTTYIYSVKLVCGMVTPPRPKPEIPTMRDTAPVVPGLYRTAVNIHNFWEKDTAFLQKVAIALPQDKERGPVTKKIETKLGPNGAVEVDCYNIVAILEGTNSANAQFLKGFVVIESPVALEVTAVYTAEDLQEKGRNTDVERIWPHIVRQSEAGATRLDRIFDRWGNLMACGNGSSSPDGPCGDSVRQSEPGPAVAADSRCPPICIGDTKDAPLPMPTREAPTVPSGTPEPRATRAPTPTPPPASATGVPRPMDTPPPPPATIARPTPTPVVIAQPTRTPVVGDPGSIAARTPLSGPTGTPIVGGPAAATTAPTPTPVVAQPAPAPRGGIGCSRPASGSLPTSDADLGAGLIVFGMTMGGAFALGWRMRRKR